MKTCVFDYYYDAAGGLFVSGNLIFGGLMATPTPTPSTASPAASTVVRLDVEQFENLPDGELLTRYRRGLELVDPRVFELSDEQFDMAFLPDAGVGNWPVRVLVGHLADGELAFTHRMRRAIAEDMPVVNSWDENAFIDSGLYSDARYPVAGFIAVIHTLRRWTAEWLGTLSPEQMARQMMHTERGPMTVRRVLVYATWHLEHHARYLNAKVCRMLGPKPEGGNCGAGCGCGKK